MFLVATAATDFDIFHVVSKFRAACFLALID